MLQVGHVQENIEIEESSKVSSTELSPTDVVRRWKQGKKMGPRKRNVQNSKDSADQKGNKLGNNPYAFLKKFLIFMKTDIAYDVSDNRLPFRMVPLAVHFALVLLLEKALLDTPRF